MDKNYHDRLVDRLDTGPYDEQAIKDIGRVCRVGCASEQTVLTILGIVEANTTRHLQAPAGLEAVEDFDRVFYPD